MNPDFSEMLSTLNAEGVEYLVVDGYAVAAHGLPRATKDIDIGVRPTTENAARTLRALTRFRAPLHGLSAADFATKGTICQVGVPPQRIDVLTVIDGVEFDEAWATRVEVEREHVQVRVIGRAALLRNKRAVGRPQDLADAAWLESSSPPRDTGPERPSRPRSP